MNRDREASLGTVIEAFGISAADTLSLARVDDTGSGPIVARCEQSSRR